MKKKLYWQLPFLVFLIVGTVFIVRQQRSTPYQHDKGQVFGTFYHITYQNDTSLNNDILAELAKVDSALSMFNDKSIISRINRGEDVKTNEMFDTVFNLAKNIADNTNGAFDITVAPLVNAWGFGFKTGNPPTKAAIDSLRSIVGYKKVALRNNRITKTDPRVMLDCSAIAKGYGCDVVAHLLQRHGIENYMVEIGGEVVTHGISEKRLPWKIGVTKPTDDSLAVDKELQTVLNVKNMAMATSGNYRNFYYKNGKKYAHTIDPKTGYPVQHNILSATVLAKHCAEADAYATSFMVMGLDGAKKTLENHPELMAYLIYADHKGNMQVWYSPSMKDKIQK
ncbi:FAD:protein FMN transferase [Prevotella sp.]|uniref:FAD:protein FMN transferase n=1 Tax=uncultured Prevotella sp. TaxID=159272 RepID=UPI0025F2239B|nr:FAD:protein FMN transferase [Prevotella sp.]MCI7119715.1 FAD:protein FMN transferase [Prevotella sp.]